jgi:hypothetical protein
LPTRTDYKRTGQFNQRYKFTVKKGIINKININMSCKLTS